MEKIKWCLEKNQGIRLIDPNKNLSQNYIIRAKEDFKILKNQNSVWQVIISYYVFYNAFYSVLMNYGIESKIHSCTIELISLFDRLKEYKIFFENLKENREKTQYFLKEPDKVSLKKIKKFINLCELENYEINQDKIEELWFTLKKKKKLMSI